MAKQYNTHGFGNDPLHTTSDGLASSFGGLLDDIFGGLLFGDPDASSKIFGELTGYNAQQREFEQQEYMTDKQNEWNSAQQQMKRAKAAGINPLTAAAGIVGNGSSSAASSEPSAAGAAAGGVNAITGAIDSFSNLRVDAAKAENDKANADKINAEIPYVPLLAHGQNMKYFGDFVSSMKDVGIAEIQSGGIAFDLMSGGLHKALDYLSLFNGFRNVDKQMKVIENEYQLGLKDLESYDVRLNANLSLQEKQGLKAAAEAAKAKLEGTYIQKKIDLENSLPGITLLQGGNLASYLAWTYGVDSPQFQAFENSVYKYAYKSQLGSYDADKETAYDRAHNSGMGNYNSDPFQQQYRELYDEIDKLSDLDSECDDLLSALTVAHDDGKISDDVFNAQRDKILENQRSIRDSSKTLIKHFSKMSYSAGHASQLQDIKGDLVKIGVAVGLYSVGKSSPSTIKGFSR